VRSNVISADSDNIDPSGIEVRLGSRERLTLQSADRRIVFRIEVDDQPLPGEIDELGDLAVLIGRAKFGKGLPAESMREVSFLS